MGTTPPSVIEVRLRRFSSGVIAIALLGSACSSSAPPVESAPVPADVWMQVVSQGLALAPVVGVQVITGTAEAAAFFSDELYVHLQAALPGTPVTSPDEVYARLDEAGEDAQSRLRSLRRRLARLEPIDAGEASAIASALGQRYLFVAFIDEGSETGYNRTNLDDYRAFEYSMGVHQYPTDELHGHAAAFLVDLQEGRELWRDVVEYVSQGLSIEEDSAQRVIDRTRSDAAFRLSEALAGAGQAP